MSPALSLLIAALAQVESGNNAHAVGKHGELGLLQITPAVIEDVNRFQRTIHFTLEDRLNPDRSWQVCRLYLERYVGAEVLESPDGAQRGALVWHRGPNVWKLRNAPECRRYWRKVRAAMVAQGRHAP